MSLQSETICCCSKRRVVGEESLENRAHSSSADLAEEHFSNRKRNGRAETSSYSTSVRIDLIVEERVTVNNTWRFVLFVVPSICRPVTSGVRSIPIAPPSLAQPENSKSWSILATSPPTPSAAAYSMMSMASSPPPVSFRSIQDQETRAHEALRILSNKSLETIQVRPSMR